MEINGGRAEYFYHHHFKDDVEFKWLLRELGIENKLKFYPTKMGFYRSGKLFQFNGIADLLKFSPMSFFDKIRFGLVSIYLSVFCDWKKCESMPALAWLRQHSGRTACASVWEPMLKIKFGDYFERVPLSWLVGRLRQRLHSRSAGQETLGYVTGSLSELLAAIEAKLGAMDVEIKTNAPVEEIIYENKRVKGVRAKGDFFYADEVLFTTPTTILAPLVKEHDAAYGEALSKLEYFGALCVVVETSRALSDIYWTNVADADFPFGGVIEHTNIVPAQAFKGSHVTYLSRYFELSNKIAKQSDAEIAKEFLAALQKMFPTLRNDEIKSVKCFRSSTAAPVCDLDFSKKLPRYDTPLTGLYVASMPQLYPDERSCNNCVRLAAGALARMGYDTQAVPQGPTLAGIYA